MDSKNTDADLIVRADDGAAQTRADADAGAKLDQILSGLDSMSKRMDAMEQRSDAMTRRMDDDAARNRKDEDEERARKDAEESVCKYSGRKDDDDDASYARRHDAEESAEAKEREAKGEPKEVAADKAKKHRKDAEERDGKARADAAARRKDEDDAKARKDAEETKARTDSTLSAENAALKARLDALEQRTKPISEEDRNRFAEIQARADSVFQDLGKSAGRPMEGESTLGYRRRLLTQVKVHSPTWKDVELSTIADSAMLDIAERQIFEDARKAARVPADLKDNELRAIIRTDAETGTRTINFVGKNSFVVGMKPPAGRAVKAIRTPTSTVN